MSVRLEKRKKKKIRVLATDELRWQRIPSLPRQCTSLSRASETAEIQLVCVGVGEGRG